MKKHKLLLAIVFAFMGKLVIAQSSPVIKAYIETYKDIAISEMQRTGVPAAITLAQGIHETGAGTSDLVRRSNNHFGIKCKSDWKGESVSHDDDARGECFRKYNDPYESYRDHSDFLRYRPYYTALFKLDPTDYEGWAYGLKKAGYATNPKYPQILIKLIRDYNLQDYTLIALGKKTQDDDLVWTSNEQKNESAGEARLEVVVPVQQFEAKNYPSGVFHINETKVVFVEKGTSFLKLAENYNLSLSRLFDFNDMEPGDIAANDMLLFLQRKRKTGQNEFHTVAAGETLHGIAQLEGIRLENLLAYNQLKPGMQPATGEKLYLHSVSPSMPKLANQNTPSRTGVDVKEEEKETVEADFIFHTVQPKETVFAIAKKYLVAIDDVMKWNSLQNADLKPGQQLRIIKR